jgi:hypothetical protein
MHKRAITLAALAVIGGSAAQAVPLVDGSKDLEYGAPLTIQANATGFGDNTSGTTNFANGSELDAGYARIDGGNLYIFLAGNLETNFNKLEVFIDSTAGGMNRLTAIPNNQGGFNRMADDGSGNGLTFDTGFEADHWISMTSGGATPDIFVDYAPLNPAANGNFAGQTVPLNGTLAGSNGGPTIQATFNNLNAPGFGSAPLGGVTGLTAPNDAALVTTGVEIAIPLAAIGNPTGPINISAFINGGGHDFLSNQVLGPLALGTGNLGEPRTVNFNNQAGLQYFTVVPEPATAGVLALGCVALLARRRRVA